MSFSDSNTRLAGPRPIVSTKDINGNVRTTDSELISLHTKIITMSKKLGELEAGALNAWTPIQQAALYRQYQAKQQEADELETLKEYEAEKAKAKKPEKQKPEEIKAGTIVDSWVRYWLPDKPGTLVTRSDDR